MAKSAAAYQRRRRKPQDENGLFLLKILRVAARKERETGKILKLSAGKWLECLKILKLTARAGRALVV
jgi:hypothetical protein